MRDELTVTLEEDDFVEAYRPAPRAAGQARVVRLLALLVVVILAALLILFPEARLAFRESRLIIGLAGAVIVAALLLLVLILAAPTLRRRAARSTLIDHPGMRDPIHYSLEAEHFSVKTTYTDARYPWAQLWDWREGERTIIVLPTPRNFYVIPKRGADPAVLERWRGYLMQARKRARPR
jgi:hypothetical protein